MYLIDLLGAGLTLLAIGFLLLGGYLAALRLLGEEAVRDPLALAIASLLLATAEAVGIGLLLGAAGLLRIDLALAAQAALSLSLLAGFRKSPPPGGIGAPARAILRRSWAILRAHPALSLVALHGVGSEALRGLLRPPLSWDSLMYHLLLAGTWLRDQNLNPVFGNIPNNYYGYVPANGSVWFWWWMAPSHSEFWINLATLPHWVLLGLATGGIARRLGAGRHWPLASFLILLTPTVVRFAAAQYVDIFVGAVLLSAAFFALRWIRDADWGAVILAGAGLGLAAGTKVLGVFYAVALAGTVVPLARGEWRRRVPQVIAALAVAVLLGSFFYVRNIAWGADPLALTCEKTASGPQNGNTPTIPRQNSVIDLWRPMMHNGWLVDAFLGITRPAEVELGVGPQVFVMLLAALLLPFGLGRERWRESLIASAQIWAQLAFWLAVPFAKNYHVFANVRYLMPAMGLAFAGGIALAERRRISDRWMEGITLAFLLQGLLQLHAEMPHGVRVAIAIMDLAAVTLALSPFLRGFLRHRWREAAAAAVLLALLGAPFLTQFRVWDRGRALAEEYQVHMTSTRFFAGGWSWLDVYGGDGAVASVHSPNNYFQYPAMGPRLERESRYINFNAADHQNAVEYPACQPRVDPDPRAWVTNLAKHRIRWVHLSRYPQFDFTIERQWADSSPRLFALRYENPTNRIYEFLPNSPAEPSPAAPPAAAPARIQRRPAGRGTLSGTLNRSTEKDLTMGKVDFTGNYEDLSTDRGYQFKFFCEKCGNGYMSSFQTSKLGLAASAAEVAGSLFGGLFGKVSDTAYQIQRAVGGPAHDSALREATEEIRPLFKQCTRCGRYVCEPICFNNAAGLCEWCAPDMDEEIASAQAEAAKNQAFEKAHEVDWMKNRNLGQVTGATCKSCGAKTGGAKFCPECGTPTAAQKKSCGGCGAEMEGSPRFCPECGQKTA